MKNPPFSYFISFLSLFCHIPTIIFWCLADLVSRFAGNTTVIVDALSNLPHRLYVTVYCEKI